MFVNYFRSPMRESPVNIVVARIVLSGYVIWKTIWYDWELVAQTPFSLAAEVYTILLPPAAPFMLTVEKWALILVMVSFAVGYRLLLSSFLGATLLGHLATIRFTLNPDGGTTALFIAVWFIIFFGLFHEQRGFAIDSFRIDLVTPSNVERFLKSEPGPFRMDALRWSLLAIALVYFGAGISKVIHGPLLEWATVENLSRTIVMINAKNDIIGGIGPYLVQYPKMMFLAAWGTIILELGFILAVLLGISITPFILGFFAMKLIIGLAMGPFFFDIYLLFLPFVAWDDILGATASDNRLDVVYNEHSLVCAWALSFFKVVDIRNIIDFYSQHDPPKRYQKQRSCDFDSTIYVFKDGERYCGYYAFRELFKQYNVFSWVAWIMSTPLIAIISKRLYEFIVNNRGRYSVRSAD